MEWDYVEPLKSESLIDEFEQFRGYKFPHSFRECVLKNNGGCPDFDTFDTEETEARCFGFLYTFNKDDKLNIWEVVERYKSHIEVSKQYGYDGQKERYEEILNRYVIFADTPFGDDIAFDMSDDSVVLISHETLQAEKIADSFDAFLDCLYEYEDDD